MTQDTNQVPLTPSQIRFILDMMMGCPLGATQSYSALHQVDDAELYNHLLSFLNDPQWCNDLPSKS